uniref:Uncharacterized protein n=1 Tax=Talaromyces marneffei PM1 TaxID=1077442 RepID=A0A093V2M4_TALMA
MTKKERLTLNIED